MKKLALTCFFSFVFIPFWLYGQLNANFTANKTSGCAPLTVNFTDVSTGGTPTWRHWEFGNGNFSTGNNQNPVATYINPGVYTVKLTVAQGTDTSTITKTNYIEVFQNPVVDFSFLPANGCAPLQVQFTNLTNTFGSGISSAVWAFGDGSPTVNATHPLHIYQNHGVFSVNLQVTDSNGCTGILTKPAAISAQETPSAQFTGTPPLQSCAPPLNINFNVSLPKSGVTYTWYFGDGTTSNQTNPLKTYNQSGVFDVMLVAQSSFGCVDSFLIPQYVKILPTQAQFNIPDTICLENFLNPLNLSVGASSFQWQVSNGYSSTSSTFGLKLPSSGSYTITLTAADGPTCTDTKVDTFYVEKPIANFVADSLFACSLPFTINYFDSSSSNVVAWQWTLDDNLPLLPPISSSLQNPSRTVYSNLVTNDRLVVFTNNGCTDTLYKANHVRVSVPDAKASINNVAGCAPLKVEFFDISNSYDSITNIQWFVDSNLVSTAPFDSFFFQTPGEYYLKLYITTQLGCIDSILTPISAGFRPIVSFLADTDSTCAFSGVQFFDKSFDSTKTDFWSWSFTDGSPPYTKGSFTHNFIDTGWVGLKLVVGIDGCFDTLETDSVVYVLGPYVEAYQQFNCADPLTRNLSVNQLGVDWFYWDFGDSLGYDSSTFTPTYTYQQRGDYTVTLFTRNDSTGCIFNETIEVKPRQIQAIFTESDSITCAPSTISFNALASVDVFGSEFEWLFGNSVQANFTPFPSQLIFNQPGLYKNRLIVTDINGCKDTLIRNLRLHQPVAQFTVPSKPLCSGTQLTVNNFSVYDTTKHISLWQLSNGDTLTTDSIIKTFETLKPVSKKVLTTFDTVLITLKITDTLGCEDETSHQVLIYKPGFNPQLSKQNLCKGEATGFGDSLFMAGQQITWIIPNVDTLQGNSVFYYTDTSGIHIPYVVKTDTNGCEVTDTLPGLNIQEVRMLKILANPKDTTCYPAQVTFTDSTDADSIKVRIWDFGVGQGKVINSGNTSFFNYTNPGDYSIKLIVETHNGCTDSSTFSNFITIGGPIGNLTILPDTGCKGDSIVFRVDSAQNIGFYQIDFGDGLDTIVTSQQFSIARPYDQIGTVNPILILSDTSGTCLKYSQAQVFIHRVEAAYKFLTDSAGCSPLQLGITDNSVGGSLTQWYQNNVLTPFTLDSFSLNLPDTYKIKQLVISTETGCRDSVIKEVVVYPNPIIHVSNDTLICQDDSIKIFAFGAQHYKWMRDLVLLPDTLAQIVASPKTKTSYTVFGTDSFGCESFKKVAIDVQPKFNILISTDTTIYVGEEVPVFGYGTLPVNIVWSPPTGLPCTNCPETTAKPLKTTTYTVTITDENGCFIIDSTFTIEVIQAFSVDLPQVFSPNGDGLNDIIFPNGWGIKSVEIFIIYNRWGEKIFESNDIKKGWDGTYKGVPQEMDTYVYYIKVKNHDDKEMEKKGYITLIR